MIASLLHSLLRAILDGLAYVIVTAFVGSLFVPPEWLP